MSPWSRRSDNVWKATPFAFDDAYPHYTEVIVVNDMNHHWVFAMSELEPGSFYAGSVTTADHAAGDSGSPGAGAQR